MNYSLKLARRLNIRSRRSDRRNFWYAVLTAVGAQILFWSAFSYREIPKAPPEHTSSVTMLSREETEEIGCWLRYHDPAAFHRGEYRKFIDDASLKSGNAAFRGVGDRPEPELPTPRAAVGSFRELTPSEYTPPAVLPLPPPRRPAPAKRRSGGVTDGAGKPLPVGEVKLPARTPGAGERTTLRILNPGRFPTLMVERSCGDPALDRRAQQLALPLAMSASAPAFVVVEWPDPETEVRP